MAQTVTQTDPSAPRRAITPTTADATRGELQAALADAERHGRTAVAGAIRTRLAQGDFQTGDHVQIVLTADSVRRYDAVVREGVGLEFMQLPPLSLVGVLRSELESTLDQYFRRFFRNPEVRATPLIRVSVSGAVGKPGVFSLPPDTQVGDVLNATAGVAGNARTDKVEIRRGNAKLIDAKQFQTAVRTGSTLADAGVHSGDEVRVPERKQGSRAATLGTIALAVSAFTSLLFLIRSAYNN